MVRCLNCTGTEWRAGRKMQHGCEVASMVEDTKASMLERAVQ